MPLSVPYLPDGLWYGLGNAAYPLLAGCFPPPSAKTAGMARLRSILSDRFPAHHANPRPLPPPAAALRGTDCPQRALPRSRQGLLLPPPHALLFPVYLPAPAVFLLFLPVPAVFLLFFPARFLPFAMLPVSLPVRFPPPAMFPVFLPVRFPPSAVFLLFPPLPPPAPAPPAVLPPARQC